MKKYYLIPIADDNIYLNGKLLRNILNSSHPDLVRMEEEKIELLYSVSPILKLPQSVKKDIMNII